MAQQIYYPSLASLCICDSDVLDSMKEDKFSELNSKTSEALKSNDFQAALNFSTKAAMLYGLPGLLVYLKAAIAFQVYEKSSDNLSEQGVINIMTLVLVAQKLAEDRIPQDMTQEHLPSEAIHSSHYWQDKLTSLINLKSSEFKKHLPRCEDLSQEIYDLCVASTSNGSKMGR